MDGSARKAASVAVLREAPPGFEILMLKRSSALDYMPDIWVFPGGKLEQEDMPAGGTLMDALQVAARRELEEEAGFSYDGPLIHCMDFITPDVASVRFATTFFVVLLDHDVSVQVDGSEMVEARWARPQQLLQEFQHEALRLMIPNGLLLMQLACQFSLSDAERHFKMQPPQYVAPVAEMLENNPIKVLLAGDHKYPAGPGNKSGEGVHRIIHDQQGKPWRYIHETESSRFPRLDGGYCLS